MSDGKVEIELSLNSDKIPKQSKDAGKTAGKNFTDAYKGEINRKGANDLGDSGSTIPGSGKTPWTTNAGGTGSKPTGLTSMSGAQMKAIMAAEQAEKVRAANRAYRARTALKGFAGVSQYPAPIGPEPPPPGYTQYGKPIGPQRMAMPAPIVPRPQFQVTPPTTLQSLFNKAINFPLSNAGKNITIMAAGLAALRVSIGLVTYALRLILAPFKAFARMLGQAYENGKRLYAHAMTSGVPMGMSVQRSALAAAFGVSEGEVFQFGKAIQWVGDRFKNSSEIMAKTAPTLAAVSWAGAALSQSFKALWAQLANEFAPVVIYLKDAVRLFIDSFSQSDLVVGLGKELAVVFSAIAVAVKVVMLAVQGLGLIFQALADTLEWVMIKVNNLIARIPGARKLGFTPISDKDTFSGTKKMAEAVAKSLENNNPFKAVNAPAAQAYMKQMPASNWERMGLVVGAGGGTNYAMQTANHTKRTVSVLERILNATQGRANITDARGLAATA